MGPAHNPRVVPSFTHDLYVVLIAIRGPEGSMRSYSSPHYSPYRRGSSGGSSFGAGGAGQYGGGLPEYLRRMLDYQQMDFEAAFEDITMLCSSNPQRM